MIINMTNHTNIHQKNTIKHMIHEILTIHINIYHQVYTQTNQ